MKSMSKGNPSLTKKYSPKFHKHKDFQLKPRNLVSPSSTTYWQHSRQPEGFSPTHSHTQTHTSTSLHTKDLFSAHVEGSGLGRPFDVGTPRSERTVCAALNSIPHNSSLFSLLLASFYEAYLQNNFYKK